VITGTVIEAKTESHKAAALFTYGHPMFAALLMLYFVNILFSALRRWPFRKRHIPFLMTHLGLLMIISGTLVKVFYGVQGNLMLIEGSGSHTLMLPHSEAIAVQKRDFSYATFPVKDILLLHDDIVITLNDYWENAQAIPEGWIVDHTLHITGFEPIPVGEKRKLVIDGSPWWVIGYEGEEPRLHVDEFPALLIGKGADALYQFTLISKSGERVDQTLNLGQRDHTIVYEGGFGGYGFQATLEYPLESEEERIQKGWEQLREQLQGALDSSETLSPPLQSLFQVCQKEGQDFTFVIIDYLKQWHGSGRILFPENRSHPIVERVQLTPQDQKVLFWISKMITDIEPELSSGIDPIAVLEARLWPMVDQIKSGSEHASPLTLVAQQIEKVAPLLPPPEEQLSTSHLFSAMCLLHGLDLEEVLGSIDWESVPLKKGKLVVETPLSQRIEPLPTKRKLEDNTPAVMLEVKSKGQSELVPLVFDPHASSLFWPVNEGQLALR